MKSKKKMLLALGAMSAAAIGAGATSTFAWYQATIGGQASGIGTATVQTSKIEYNISNVDFPILKATASVVNGTLELAHYNNTSDNAVSPYLSTGYMDAANKFHELGYHAEDQEHSIEAGPNLVSNEHALYVALSVTLSVDTTKFDGSGNWTDTSTGIAYSKTSIYEALQAKITAGTLKVTITAAPSENSRARVFATAANGTDNTVTTGQETLTGTMGDSWTQVVSVCNVYIYGGDVGAGDVVATSYRDTASTLTSSLDITITAA